MALAIEPANCVFVIPPAFTVTAPAPETAKSAELNDATPVTAVVANLGVIVNTSLDMDVAIRVPPVAPAVAPLIVNVSPSVLPEDPLCEVNVTSFADTAPEDTVNISVLKDAIPFTVVVASLMLTAPLDTSN